MMQKLNMPKSNEKDFVLNCIKCGFFSGDTRVTGAFLDSNPDWNRVKTFVDTHNLGPLVFYSLKNNSLLDGIPQSFREYLLKKYRATGLKNTILFEELEWVLKSLSPLGIDVILLKGTVLAEYIWGNASLRPMADIDLLAREEHCDAIEKLLLASGYVSIPLGHSMETYKEEHRHIAPLYNPKKKIFIEIHKDLLSGKTELELDVQGLWKRSVVTDFRGSEVRLLSPEDFLIHLCLHHLAIHDSGLGEIRDLADIAKTVSFYNHGLDWNRILEFALSGHFIRYIYYPLLFSKTLLGAPVDAKVIAELRNRADLSWLNERTIRGALRNNILQAETVNIVPSWFYKILARELLRNASLKEKSSSFFKSFAVKTTAPVDAGHNGVDSRHISLNPVRILSMFLYKLSRNFFLILNRKIR